MKLPGAATSRSTNVSKNLHCRTFFILLLIWFLPTMSYWLFSVHSHSFYHILFHGLSFPDYSGHRYYIRRSDGQVGNLVSEEADRRQAYRNSSVIARVPSDLQDHDKNSDKSADISPNPSTCATVEEMGLAFSGRTDEASLRVRKMIQGHFAQHGAARVRELPPEQFCRHNFVFGRATEAGFGNEMYKILTAAALSLLLNRSLIIGKNRAELPFGDYIAYSDQSFSLEETKLLWVRNDCAGKYKRPLVMRIDDFKEPKQTGVLCENWIEWKQPIVRFRGTTDTVAFQFFLKNMHPTMREAAFMLLGDPRVPSSRPNLFGELMKVVIFPRPAVEEAVNWALNGGPDPDITLHMRLRASRPRRAIHAASSCIQKVLNELPHNNVVRPRMVLVTDMPSIVEHVKQNLKEYVEIIHFDSMSYSSQNSSKIMNATYFLPSEKRAKDWGPMPRWVAIVDFFLASRTTHAVISGACRRVGTTYAQLIAAMAAANKLDESLAYPFKLSFYSSFQSTILVKGLANQVGWGPVWNRFGGQLSCHNQTDQCALTPLLPCGWWDGPWQSPTQRDIRRIEAYGVDMKDTGEILETSLLSLCKSRNVPIKTLTLQLPSCRKNCQK